jgi:adenylate cyclase
MVIENLLAPYGYTVTMCVHGMQCLEVLESRDYPPDLLLLDIMMPHVSGYEVCEKLREKYTRIELPIIMISAKVDTESVSKCIELGSNDFVHKPFHRQELLSRIKAQLELKAMMQVQVDYQLSSNMLRLMMPDDVAHRVLNGEATILDSFDDATYLFAEAVVEGGCKRVDAEIIQVMNSLSAAFEEICHNNDISKVERNGSNILMAVADSDKHALRAVHMAIDLVEQTRHIGNSKCFFRVAMNSGSSKAAVMGEKMSNYCFLGDDVSQARLLLNLALPNMIVVSAKTRSMLKNHDELQFLQLEDDNVVGNGLALREAYCVVDDNVEWNGAVGFKNKCGVNEMGGVTAAISQDDQDKQEHASDRGKSEAGSQHDSPMADAFRSKTFDFGGFGGQEGGLSPRGRNALKTASGMAFRSWKLADRRTPSAVAESDDAETCRELRKLLESRDSQLNDLSRRFEELKRSNVSSPAKTNSNQLQCYASDTVNDDGPSFSSGGSGSTQMCDFLTRIRMRSKVSTFQEVGLCSVADLVDLSESEMARVGIVNLGEQVRLRRSAQLWIQSVQAGLIEALPTE